MVLHRRLVPGLGPVAYLPLGPVLAPGAHRVEAMDAVCDAIADLARHRFAATFVQPMTGDQGVSDRLLRRGFRRSAAGIAPVASIAVDVAEPYAGLRSGTRSSIKRAAREGVQVRRADATDLPLVAGLLAETAEHHHFSAASLEHLQGLHEALAPGGHLQIFLAERDGTPLAADVLTGSGGVLTLRLTGMRRDPETRKIGASGAVAVEDDALGPGQRLRHRRSRWHPPDGRRRPAHRACRSGGAGGRPDLLQGVVRRRGVPPPRGRRAAVDPGPPRLRPDPSIPAGRPARQRRRPVPPWVAAPLIPRSGVSLKHVP